MLMEIGDTSKMKDMEFGGSPKEWINLFKGNRYAEPGVVLLLFGGEQRLDTCIAGWHILLSHVKNIKDEKAFPSVEHIVPANAGGRNVVDDLRAAVETRLIDENVPTDNARKQADRIRYHILSTNDANVVISALDHATEGAAVAISCAQLYRYNEQPSMGSNAIYETWHDAKFRASSKEDLYFYHLMKLVTEALEKARDRKIFVSVFCEELGLNELPSHLQEHPDLVVLTTGTDDRRKQNAVISDWISRVSKEGTERILLEVNATISDARNRAQISAFLYSVNHQFHKAWATIAPYFDSMINADKTIRLSASSMALAAGKFKESESLLRSALDQGLASFEELNQAYQVAKGLDLSVLREMLVDQMIAAYPKQPVSLWRRFDRYVKERDFISALDVAKELKDDFLVSLCETFSKSTLAVEDFLKKAEKLEKLENAYILAAEEAAYRNEIALAKEMSIRVTVDGKLVSRAYRLRASVLGKLIRNRHKIDDSDIAELKEILHFAANHPVDFDVRFEVEELLETGMEEPAAFLMLVTILTSEIERSLVEVSRHDFRFETSDGLKIDPTYIEQPEGVRRIRNLLDELSTPVTIFGVGAVSNSLKKQITPELLGALSQTISYESHHIENGAYSFIDFLLHTIVLLSREIENPNADFIVVRQVIGHLASEGHIQKARDLAETTIQYMTDSHTAYRQWRLGQSWACFADSFHRSGNLLAALRYLCLCFISCETFNVNRTLLNSSYRLACRIFRDIGLTELALKTLDVERQIIESTDGDKHHLHQVAEMKFIISSSKINEFTKIATILEYVEQADQLLGNENNREVEPLLIAQSYLLKYLRAAGVEAPQSIVNSFETRCRKLRNLSITLGHPATEFSVLFPRSQGPASAY